MLNVRTSIIAVVLIIFAAVLLVVFHPWGASNDTYTNTYSSDVYKVSFNYPSGWSQEAGESEKYAGASGYFIVSVGSSDLSLDSILASSTEHRPNPYGTSPTTETLQVDGEAAGLIVPSNDQDPAMEGQAALIISYPKPVTIDGQEYTYLVLLSDEAHLRHMADTLSFK